MYSDFVDTFNKCMEEVVPKKQMRVSGRRKRPPWYNEEVQRARHEVNIVRKSYKRRKTPTTLTELRQKEDELNLIEEKAKQKWTEEVCEKVSNADTHSEMWQHFKKLTTYHDEDGVGVLPLLDEHNTAVFDKEGKAEILKNTFFAGAHLKDIPFDETFKEEVERDAEHMKNGCVSSNVDWGRDMEFSNGNISLEEV